MTFAGSKPKVSTSETLGRTVLVASAAGLRSAIVAAGGGVRVDYLHEGSVNGDSRLSDDTFGPSSLSSTAGSMVAGRDAVGKLLYCATPHRGSRLRRGPNRLSTFGGLESSWSFVGCAENWRKRPVWSVVVVLIMREPN
jgi:hypothetical protein